MEACNQRLSFAVHKTHYRMSHDRWHAFNQSEVLNAVQYSVVFPFTSVRCTQRASIGYWPGPISNTGPLSTPYTRKGKQLPQARFHTPSNSTVRFRTGSSDKVYEKSIGSRFDKVSDDDIEKIIAEQKNRNTKDATDKWLKVFEDFCKSNGHKCDIDQSLSPRDSNHQPVSSRPSDEHRHGRFTTQKCRKFVVLQPADGGRKA